MIISENMNNSELESFQDLAVSFSKKELFENREDNDRYPFGPFFDYALDKAHEIGFLSITLPEDMGGVGQDISALCVILNRICQDDSSLGGIVFTNSFAQEILLCADSRDILNRIVSSADNAGDNLIAFPSFSNPDETKSLVKAGKGNGAYLLSGHAEYIVLGGLASHAVIPAKIHDQDEYSLFLVDLSGKGITKSEPVFSLGLHACPANDLTLNDVHGELIGNEGEGGRYFEEVSDQMYVAAAAMSAGVMKGAFYEAFDYAKERFQGGREIIKWSEVEMILANMAIKLKNAEMIVTRAYETVVNRGPDWEFSSRAAALHVQEMACELTTDGIQLLGGNGYMKDYGQEKRFRDAKQLQALLGIAPMSKIRYIKQMIERDVEI